MEVKFANLESQEVRIVSGEMRLFEGGVQQGSGVALADGPYRISVRKEGSTHWLYYSDAEMADGTRYYISYDPKGCGIDHAAGYLKIKKTDIPDGPSGRYGIVPVVVSQLEDIMRHGDPDEPAGLFNFTDLYVEGDNNFYAELSIDTYDSNVPVVRLTCTNQLKRYVRIVLI